VRTRWLSKRAFVLHFLLVTVVPGCLLAGWWQVHRALSGNLLSYFYSVEWPIFALLGVVAWWQLVHDERTEGDFARPQRARRSRLHRDDEMPSRPLVWDKALESPELAAYNDYLRALAKGRGRKTWGNPRGLPLAEQTGTGSGAMASTSAVRASGAVQGATTP
jgi:DNA-binding transcriptional regulator of glucitol operon